MEASIAKAAGTEAKQQAKAKLTPEQEASVTLSPDAPIQARKDLKYLQKNLKQTETRMGKLVTAKKELEERMAIPSVVSDYLLMDKLARELEALESDIEKEEIAKYVKEEHQIIDLAISKAKKEISSIKEYRESLITDLVTGKRSVPQLQMS